MIEQKRIVLNLMTEKGYEALKAILPYKQLISFVVIGKDKSIKDDYSKKMENLCSQNQINYYLKGDEPNVKESQYLLAVSWRWMINHPNNRLIVFHDSILPKYRGFAPLVNMLINGENEIGVSAIFGADEYDKGEIIAQESSPISYPLKIQDAIRINNENFKKLLKAIFEKIALNEDIDSSPQEHTEATYSIWRDYDDYYVEWEKTSGEIKRLIDAVSFPYLGARSKITDGGEIIIEEAEICQDVTCELRHIGKVIFVEDGCPIIICGEGLLKITKASYTNSKPPKDFLPLKNFRLKFF